MAVSSTSKIMAFNISDKISPSDKSKPQFALQGTDNESPKLTKSQLNILMKDLPAWLRDSSGFKQLPGVYLGVLGQVQLQPNIIKKETGLSNGLGLVRSNDTQVEYVNRFTHTERVHQLLSASQLPDETLAAIWAHVNKTFPGQLTNREVCWALALIAIFQRLEAQTGISIKERGKSPFELVKLEKKPPVPKLYPADRNRKQTETQVMTSRSIPENLNSIVLLVDIQDDSKTGHMPDRIDKHSSTSNSELFASSPKVNMANKFGTNSFNLIDMAEEKHYRDFEKLTGVWSSFLKAIKSLFKRCFDILMVENSRQSALEALRSEQGQDFARHLCLCYPMGHNIKCKIDELRNLKLEVLGTNESVALFEKQYLCLLDDLMTSINEYWAVLINLFHESGQTKFVEAIMDGLNYPERTSTSPKTFEEVVNMLDSFERSENCSICHNKFYLKKSDASCRQPDGSDGLRLIVDQNDLITDDSEYYYHARCANFWLNHVDPTTLPFLGRPRKDILSPTTLL